MTLFKSVQKVLYFFKEALFSSLILVTIEIVGTLNKKNKEYENNVFEIIIIVYYGKVKKNVKLFYFMSVYSFFL